MLMILLSVRRDLLSGDVEIATGDWPYFFFTNEKPPGDDVHVVLQTFLRGDLLVQVCHYFRTSVFQMIANEYRDIVQYSVDPLLPPKRMRGQLGRVTPRFTSCRRSPSLPLRILLF